VVGFEGIDIYQIVNALNESSFFIFLWLKQIKGIIIKNKPKKIC